MVRGQCSYFHIDEEPQEQTKLEKKTLFRAAAWKYGNAPDSHVNVTSGVSTVDYIT